MDWCFDKHTKEGKKWQLQWINLYDPNNKQEKDKTKKAKLQGKKIMWQN